MALVTKIREWREIPHEPGNRFRIQKLSWKQLEDATETFSARAREKMNAFNPGIFTALRKENREEALQQLNVDEDELAKAEQDPLTGYDVFTLLRHGLIEWDGPEYGDKLTDQARTELDEETKDWAAREILKLAKPELFPDEDDEAGNGSSSSINSSTRVSDLTGPRMVTS